MGSHSYLQNLNYCSGSACNQMYLMNMPTNIGTLQTAGLLNSHASPVTTTNVAHLNGGRSSVISLSELNLLAKDFKIPKKVAEAIGDRADTWDHFVISKIEANKMIPEADQTKLELIVDGLDKRIHNWADRHTQAL